MREGRTTLQDLEWATGYELNQRQPERAGRTETLWPSQEECLAPAVKTLWSPGLWLVKGSAD